MKTDGREPTQCNTTEYLVMGTVAALSSILPLGRFHRKNLKPTGLILSCAGTSPRQIPISGRAVLLFLTTPP